MKITALVIGSLPNSGARVVILYEYPFNERIRTLLRLEDLFERFDHHAQHQHPFDHHAALTTLFEIIEVAGRADLKSDLLQELERQRQALTIFRGSPDVELTTLESVLTEIEIAARGLGETTGKPSQYLRDNDWLMSIRSRTIIPGGACEFDLPSYFAWQNKPWDERQAALSAWIAPMLPLRKSMTIVLKLLRKSGQSMAVSAINGSYQQSLTNRSYQMLQLRLPSETTAIPEVSANKHVLWIRFTQQAADQRTRPYDDALSFDLTLCNL